MPNNNFSTLKLALCSPVCLHSFIHPHILVSLHLVFSRQLYLLNPSRAPHTKPPTCEWARGKWNQRIWNLNSNELLSRCWVSMQSAIKWAERAKRFVCGRSWVRDYRTQKKERWNATRSKSMHTLHDSPDRALMTDLTGDQRGIFCLFLAPLSRSLSHMLAQTLIFQCCPIVESRFMLVFIHNKPSKFTDNTQQSKQENYRTEKKKLRTRERAKRRVGKK